MDGPSFLNRIADLPAYQMIAEAYQGRFARRSGLAYINHIHEGSYLLYHRYGFDESLISAYCVHPLFQSDRLLRDLVANGRLERLSRPVIVLAMEYRRVANGYTLTDPIREAAKIDLGPLIPVHQLLTADKIQNKKDFMQHMYEQADRPSYRRAADRAVAYFDSWLTRLGLSDAEYSSMVAILETSGFDSE